MTLIGTPFFRPSVTQVLTNWPKVSWEALSKTICLERLPASTLCPQVMRKQRLCQCFPLPKFMVVLMFVLGDCCGYWPGIDWCRILYLALPHWIGDNRSLFSSVSKAMPESLFGFQDIKDSGEARTCAFVHSDMATGAIKTCWWDLYWSSLECSMMGHDDSFQLLLAYDFMTWGSGAPCDAAPLCSLQSQSKGQGRVEWRVKSLEEHPCKPCESFWTIIML